MGNAEHLEILMQGVETWNEWREKNPDVKPDFNEENLSVANLKGANLVGALLNRATLTGANLAEANFSKAYLHEANLSGAKLSAANLSGAKLTGAILTETDFSGAILTNAYLNGAYATGANFTEASLDRAVLHEARCNGAYVMGAKLVEANLSEADFSIADFSAANLSKAILSRTNFFAANLTGAELREAELKEAQVLATNFNKATLTGACLQDWNINSSTNLDDVICDYVYLKIGQQERRPSSGGFAPGEFTKLFQKVIETVDLIFLNGIDWQAFLVSFQQLQVEAGEKVLSIQAIENKNEGAFVIRVSLPPELDKAKIEKSFKQKYQKALKVRDEQYRKHLRERLKDKDDLIANYREQTIEMKSIRQDNTQLIAIIKTMADKDNSKYYFNNPQIGNFIDTAQDGSRQQSINHQHNYAPEQKQTLAEAAAEIQQLLKQLEQTNPSATEAEKIAFVNDETSPSFKRRVVGAVKALGEAAIDEFVLENKYHKVAKAAIKGWIKPE